MECNSIYILAFPHWAAEENRTSIHCLHCFCLRAGSNLVVVYPNNFTYLYFLDYFHASWRSSHQSWNTAPLHISDIESLPKRTAFKTPVEKFLSWRFASFCCCLIRYPFQVSVYFFFTSFVCLFVSSSILRRILRCL